MKILINLKIVLKKKNFRFTPGILINSTVNADAEIVNITFRHRYQNLLTVHGKVVMSQWMAREAGWRNGIISTVPYEQQKL